MSLSFSLLFFVLLLITTANSHCPELFNQGTNWAAAHCIEKGAACDRRTSHLSGLCKSAVRSENQSLECRKSACSYCECHHKMTMCDSTLFHNLCVHDTPANPVKPRQLWMMNRKGWHLNSDAYNADIARKHFANQDWLSIPASDVLSARNPWILKAEGRCWTWNVKEAIKGGSPAKSICYFFRMGVNSRFNFSVTVPSRETPELKGVHAYYPNLLISFYNASNDNIGSLNFNGGTYQTPLLYANQPYKICALPKNNSFSFCGLHFWLGELNDASVLNYGTVEMIQYL